jgi:glucosamine--fructose-6-phosphate aminotransferase (isomerizing)
MAREIAEQPEVLDRLLADGASDATAIRARIDSFGPRFVVLAARGTSDHAALYAKYLVETRLELPAGLASPSTLTLYGARPDLTGVLFVAVSQSGRSPDLLGSLAAARERGALTLAVTNDAASPLATAAELHFDVRAGAERAVAATKSYTAQLLALYLLLGGPRSADEGDLAALPAAAERTLAGMARVDQVVDRYRFAERLVTTARGFSYPTAREAALKVMETCYLSAHAFSGADLLHGPLAMVDATVPVIAVVSPGVGGDAMRPVLDRLREVGADVVQVGDPGGLPIASESIAEELLPILEILPLQQLAWRLALERGGDPDRPRGLSKVTETW